MFLIRHAQAAHNVNDDFSIFDPELTAVGIQQAKSFDHSSIQEIKTVVCSTSNRAIQTAMYMFPDHQIMATDLALEYNTGIPCNSRHELSISKVKYPQVDFHTLFVDPLQTERYKQQGLDRAKRLLSTVSGLSRPIAIVTHLNFMREVAEIVGKRREVVHNCGIIEL